MSGRTGFQTLFDCQEVPCERIVLAVGVEGGCSGRTLGRAKGACSEPRPVLSIISRQSLKSGCQKPITRRFRSCRCKELFLPQCSWWGSW